MENKCIITKIPGIINLDLITPDEIRVYTFHGERSATVAQNFSFGISTVGNITFRVLGGHLYTDSARTQEITEDYTFSSGSLKFFYATHNNYDFKLAIFGKQNIYKWSVGNVLAFPLNQVKYCTSLSPVAIMFAEGELQNVKYIDTTNLNEITFCGNLKGTFDADSIEILNSAKILGSYIDIGNPLVFLDPSGNVNTYRCYNPNSYNLGDFANYPNLRSIFQNAKGNSTWESRTKRDLTYAPLGLRYVKFASPEDVDNYLINMANCAGSDTTGASKEIYITAPYRTSESDSAVATLTSRGYTVTCSKEN